VLGRPSTVRCDVIQTIEKSRAVERAAVLPRAVMAEVDAALRRSLALK
jgi:mRNA-degrading endonuclease toxin of MazEF toxin-antitoxin module